MNRILLFVVLLLLVNVGAQLSLCTNFTEINNPMGTIGTSSYPVDHECTWLLSPSSTYESIYLEFSRMDTELNFDFVNVYSGENLIYTISGSEPASVNLNVDRAETKVVFKSDGSLNGKGFTLNYYFDTCKLAPCYPGGFCNSTANLCSCFNGRTGSDCKQPTCGTSSNCNQHGKCVSDQCNCDPGWSGFVCDQPWSAGRYNLTSDTGRVVDHVGMSASAEEIITAISPASVSSMDDSSSSLIQLAFKIIDIPPTTSLTVYDGETENSPILAKFTGKSSPRNLFAYSGNVFLKYPQTNFTINGRAGYDFDYTTVICQNCPKNQGVCQLNGSCNCLPGFAGIECADKVCNKDCWGHGTCDAGQCSCDTAKGWSGSDCSICADKNAVCAFELKEECGRITNDTVGLVTSFSDCKRTITPTNSSGVKFVFGRLAGNVTVGNLRYSTSYQGMLPSPIYLESPLMITQADANSSISGQYFAQNCSGCSGTGVCVEGSCVCNPGYQGSNCSEPICLNNCSGDGVCVDGSCQCVKGWGVDCSQTFCSGIKTIQMTKGVFPVIKDHTQGQYSSPNTNLCQWRLQSNGSVSLVFEQMEIGDSILLLGNEVAYGIDDGGQNYVNLAPANVGSNATITYKYVPSSDFPGHGFTLVATLLSDCHNSCNRNGACYRGRCVCFFGFAGDSCQVTLKIKPIVLNSTQSVNGTLDQNEYAAYKISLYQQSFLIELEQSSTAPFDSVAVMYLSPGAPSTTRYFFTTFYSLQFSDLYTADYYILMYGSSPGRSKYTLTLTVQCPVLCTVGGGGTCLDSGICQCHGCWTGPSCQIADNQCLDKDQNTSPGYSNGDVVGAIFAIVVIVLVSVGICLCCVAVVFKARQTHRKERIRTEHAMNARREQENENNNPATVELEEETNRA